MANFRTVDGWKTGEDVRNLVDGVLTSLFHREVEG